MCISSSWLETFSGSLCNPGLVRAVVWFYCAGKHTQAGGEKTWPRSSSLGSFLIESRRDCLQSRSEFPRLWSRSVYKRLVFEMWLPPFRWMESSASSRHSCRFSLARWFFFYPLLDVFHSTATHTGMPWFRCVWEGKSPSLFFPPPAFRGQRARHHETRWLLFIAVCFVLITY